MSDDLEATVAQDPGGRELSREVSLRQRTPPARVPGYDIKEFLGEGSYGEVWVAVDANNPGRRVAVKFYTRRGGDWALLAREVEKLNFLATDRYVVQLLDVGWSAEPPYYVMEFLERGSLAQRLEQGGPLPVHEALAVFRDVVLGVVNAHNRGVLHCDLKPANVLLGPDGKPRLADFGQSRLRHEQAPALGTLFYMAPEQADLRATPDARWDVYALGALLYTLLTGEPPYRDAPGADALQEGMLLEERLTRYRTLLETSPRPTRHRRVPGVDRALADVIDRCLAVNPARRFPNAQAVLDALDARALRRARRPLLVLGAVGPVLLLLLMGFLVRLELGAAVQSSTEALTHETRLSNSFAAEAVAEKVAGKIDRRWRTLEQAAARWNVRQSLEAAGGKGPASAGRQKLQAELEELYRAHRSMADSWNVFDAAGTLLAHVPYQKGVTDKFLGKRFAHRDFFSGLGADRKETEPPPGPLTRPYLSNAFLSTLSGTRRVGFSVPVWKGKPRQEPPLGVLLMTVEIGDFAEFRPQHSQDDGGNDYLAVLVDRKGVILEHPLLARLRAENRKEPDPARRVAREKDLAFVVAPRDWFKPGGWDADYHDPVADKHPEYAGRWLAASQPVWVEGRVRGVRDTGWWVLVQERYDIAIGPVLRLEHDMTVRGRWAVLIAVVVVTGLWLFVILVLNESAGSRLFGVLRRRAGLATASLGSVKRSARDPAPGAPTVTERRE
jgi:hypothetical protein